VGVSPSHEDGGASGAGGAAGSDHTGSVRGTSAGGGTPGGRGTDGEAALTVPGAGEGTSGEYARYLALVRRRIQESLTYPPAARRRGAAGTVRIEIVLRPDGTVSEVTLLSSSSHHLLDEAALEAARSLPRLPFPPDLAPRALRVRLPVVFELR
jgi:TonB family protein